MSYDEVVNSQVEKVQNLGFMTNQYPNDAENDVTSSMMSGEKQEDYMQNVD